MTVFSSLHFLQEAGNKLAIVYSELMLTILTFLNEKDKWAGVLVSAALHFDGAWNGMKPQRFKINHILIRKEKKIKKFRWQKRRISDCAVLAHHEWTCNRERLNRVNRGIHSG